MRESIFARAAVTAGRSIDTDTPEPSATAHRTLPVNSGNCFDIETTDISVKQPNSHKLILRNSAFRDYAFPASAKSGAGIATPGFTRAHCRARGFFMCEVQPYLSMVGCMGAEQSAPGSLVTGCCNPVQFTASEIATFGGGLFEFTREAAIMATIPTHTYPQSARISASEGAHHE